jgi:hypothetical protein
MALWILENAPFGAIFRGGFADFLRLFPRAFPSGRKWARVEPRKSAGASPEWRPGSKAHAIRARSGTPVSAIPTRQPESATLGRVIAAWPG